MVVAVPLRAGRWIAESGRAAAAGPTVAAQARRDGHVVLRGAAGIFG